MILNIIKNKEYGLEKQQKVSKNCKYLGVTLNLKDVTFRLHQKPNEQIQYIHTELKHPPKIINYIQPL